MTLSRRGILGAIICAPAIVRASSLMPVKALAAESLPAWPKAIQYFGGSYYYESGSISKLFGEIYKNHPMSDFYMAVPNET